MSFSSSDYLAHHGIKGQKWGVRRYQYPDGQLTDAGRRRYGYGSRPRGNTKQSIGRRAANAILDQYAGYKIKKDMKGSDVGKQYVDTVLPMDTKLSRIQSFENFENFAFYATYDKHDVDQYAGLFGKNLIRRANAASKSERQYDDPVQEKTVNNMGIYQLKIKATDKLKIPSEENAAHIVGNLMKDKGFMDDLRGSIADSASKMRRPSQQVLLKEAAKSLSKDPANMTDTDRKLIYKALNLSLVDHNEQQVRVQDKFYGALKENGYSALLDLNDKSYSSYHAKNPVIVFDLDKVALESVTRMDPADIEKKYKKYNRERIIKDIPEQLVGTLAKRGGIKVSHISGYAMRRMQKYLEEGNAT